MSLNNAKDTTYNYSIDLGFTPSEVVACELEMSGNYYSSSETQDGHGFVVSNGAVTSSSTYYYFHTLTAGLKFPWVDDPILYGIDSRYEFKCTYSGSKLNFSIKKRYYGSGKGLNISTKADKLYLSGTIVYK